MTGKKQSGSSTGNYKKPIAESIKPQTTRKQASNQVREIRNNETPVKKPGSTTTKGST